MFQSLISIIVRRISYAELPADRREIPKEINMKHSLASINILKYICEEKLNIHMHIVTQ